MNPTSSQGSPTRGDVVELRIPAQAGYLATVRLAAAGLAARCDLTVDDIEDLRLAVDEACSLVLPLAANGAPLEARFELTPGCLYVRASVAASGAAELNRSGFAWTVLAALASSVEISTADGRASVALTKRRATASQ